jgi:D-alanyl-D-alanine carboxypeptidase
MRHVRHTLAGCAVALAVGAWAAPRGETAPARGAAGAPATVRAAPGPSFTFSASRLGPSTRRRVSGSSWHAGCPVELDDLRLLRIGYWGFDRRARVGRMIVAASAVAPMRRAFADLFRARFPIRRMRLVDDYGASDYASIEADNTSAFNCRLATASSRFSEHAYGRAVDVNPIENPYVYPNGTTVHAASRPYLDRSRHRTGMAFAGGVLVRAFAAAGWKWGGVWRPPSGTDYQHFSATGR